MTDDKFEEFKKNLETGSQKFAKIAEETLKQKCKIPQKIIKKTWKNYKKPKYNTDNGTMCECYKPVGQCKEGTQVIIDGKVWCINGKAKCITSITEK